MCLADKFPESLPAFQNYTKGHAVQLWLDRPHQWDELIRRCYAAKDIGIDSEFYGVNVKKQSCVGRSRCHVWSVALRTKKLHPRGYHVCRGWVLPVVALTYPPMKAMLEDESVRKNAHNQSVETHTFANHGVTLRGGRNTLGLIRYYRPELVKQKGRFALKPLMMTLFGTEPVCDYVDVVRATRPYAKLKKRTVKTRICSCGIEGCRFRKGHVKTDTVSIEECIVESAEEYEMPLESIVPGHERFDLLCRYAAEDAVAALQTGEIADDAALAPPAPWPYEEGFGERPAFDQRLEEAIIDMESVGIPVDLEYCNSRLPGAEADREHALSWLHRWYVVNSHVVGPHRREEVDAVWTSHDQKLALFDSLEFPHSPVWKKGLVKRGDVKLDGTAQEWIGKNHPPAKQLMDKLLRYQRVLSGIKYLKKLIASGGMVHPVCGPAGDADDRAGAVTGRLGVKGELEAQQLPSDEKKDLYEIRRALVSKSTSGENRWRACLQVHDEIILRRPGFPFVLADYSALEVVILADLCLRLFNDRQIADMVAPGAPDVHGVNAREVFGRHLQWVVPEGLPSAGMSVLEFEVKQFKGKDAHPFAARLRDMIKTTFYGLAYRKGAYGLSVLEGGDGKMIGEKRAQEMLDAFRVAMPGIFKWHDWVSEYVRENHGIYSLGGRWCPLAEESAGGVPEWLRARGDRRATNFPMQATGAEIVGDAMVRISQCPILALPTTTAERAGELLQQHMVAATANGTRLLIPLQATIGIGDSYWDAK